MVKRISTQWELWSYDIWGNDQDGYDVNDRSCFDRDYHLDLAIELNNPGTPYEFRSGYPSDRQIRRAFGLTNIRLSLQGDDTTIYVERERDGYPIGEMHCWSHDSLSPIRARGY
jgi:hypothetical protein